MAERVCSASQDIYLHLIQVGRERARLAHHSVTVLSHQPTRTRRYGRCAADCSRETAYGRSTGTTLLLSRRPAGKERTQTSKPQWKDTRGPQYPQTYTFRNIWVTSVALDSKAHQHSWLYPYPCCANRLIPAAFVWFISHWLFWGPLEPTRLSVSHLSHPVADPHTQNTMSLVRVLVSAC